MKSNKGITLVALVITIIVLLILAGVSISLVVGDNGVLTQSQNAANKTDFASAKSALELTLTSIYSDFMAETWSDDVTAKIADNVTVSKLDEELQKNGFYIVQFGGTGDGGKSTDNKQVLVKYDVDEMTGLNGSLTGVNAGKDGSEGKPLTTTITIAEGTPGTKSHTNKDDNNKAKNTTYTAKLEWEGNNVRISNWETDPSNVTGSSTEVAGTDADIWEPTP